MLTELESISERNTSSIVGAKPLSAGNSGECKFPIGIERHDLDRLEFALTYYRHLIRLRSFVEDNASEPIQLDDVAKHIGISKAQLSRLFIRNTGIRFGDWIQFLRIANARKLLRYSDMPVSQIALSVGFSNSRSFERSFRKVSGYTASQYRQRLVDQEMSQS